MRASRSVLLPTCVLLFCLRAGAEEPDAKAGIDELIAGYGKAPSDEAAPWLHRLCHAGAEALPATRAARDAATDDRIRQGLAKAALWQLVDTILPALDAGLETQLTFDGQYAKLAEHGPEVVGALIALVEDDTAAAPRRMAAARALADVGDATMLPGLRTLHHDVLLPEFLREQAGILMAIRGDTHALDRQITRLRQLADSEEPARRELGNRELADLYYRIRDYDEAIACYDRVIEVWEAWYRTQEAAGASKEDLQRVEEVLALHYYNAACSNSLAGRFDRAKEFLRKAVKLYPSHLENIERDGDLAPLRAEKGYAEFQKELKAMFDGLSV